MTTPPIDWHARAAAITLPVRPFIDGRFVESTGAERFDSINPAANRPVCTLPAGTAEDVDRAVAAARRAFEDGRWAKATPLQRKAVLLRIAELIEANADDLALMDSLEMGKAISAARAEIAFATGFFRYYGEAVDKLYGTVAPSDGITLSLGLLEPRGVVGAIVPWNFPLINAVLKAAPALAAGNSVVLKPSEIASTSALKLAEIAAEAGLPDGALNVVPGLGPTVGQAIGRHGGIDLVSFTGSTATGRLFMTYAGQSNGKPLLLECGGKSPQVVCGDMADDLDAVAARVAHDAFWNQGQWCAAKTRLIVEDGFHDRLVEAVIRAAAERVPGDPLDPATNFGTIATRGQLGKVRGFIDHARTEGANVAFDGGTWGETSTAPAILTDVRPDMTVACEEVFGPVLSVMRFRDFDEALAIANDTAYGLAASIWTRDARRTQAAARGIRAGRVTVRASAAAGEHSGFALGAEPWGASGFGIEGGMEGLRSYCRFKSVEIVC
ncbi:aldehyde dehydrogenase family protein [Sphingosinicella microcystinivorans]|uniref:aldehyde dehydrogenase family protein n=1 Tax=Sphingosinicella microcystinivorans TaxID=335406 RepID=UPI0022F38A58|nr:aldehyde dehydrogenase family protein [Sphingosinicella microcystinivorans]WBX86278.1 aldehyde dehydrogenase family protein [Sphingosinicella microcystinivorans]